MKVILATRGSKLALWQAEATRARILALVPNAEIELEIVQSSGDRDQTSDLNRFGRIGIFTVEVDRTLRDGRAHIGVHSLKDMTTTQDEGIVLAGVLPRGPVEDVLVGSTLAGLPSGARVATGSLRRAAMLRAARPDLETVSIRGNVETRLRKLAEGAAAAVVLARAGLVRLGLDQHITEVLDTERFLPAVGQGIVGLTCRENDAETRELLGRITDPEAWAAALAERALLRELRGGCNVPAGGHAHLEAGTLTIRGRVLSIDGAEVVEGEHSGSLENSERIGRELAVELTERGARALVEAARA